MKKTILQVDKFRVTFWGERICSLVEGPVMALQIYKLEGSKLMLVHVDAPMDIWESEVVEQGDKEAIVRFFGAAPLAHQIVTDFEEWEKRQGV